MADDIRSRVLGRIADAASIGAATIDDDDDLDDDLGLCSLDRVELVMACEEEFAVELPDELVEIETVGAFVERVEALIDPKPDPCTASAKALGCTCTMGHSHSASIDPPEPIASPGCPLHGYAKDPDLARDEQRDRAADAYDDADLGGD